ncbi:hypothetical protein Glove_375g17 [Diversispora epigaea]|uniref:Crinkler effector protein N-terminal domain-containing protein n=1 Tax=Diversispora epigaea TaxID=1348612 RepID=A0A397H658_9GLOM|nr:hypothetical protein Glove_375g17 [Diversispora epigaea]
MSKLENLAKIILNCFVLGDTDLFKVVLGERIIVKNNTIPFDKFDVGFLKEFIWEKRVDIISSFKMDLWKVEIEETDKNIEKLQNIETDIKEEFKGVKLLTTSLVSEIYSNSPSKKRIHIIVQLPTTAEVSKNKTGISRLGGLGGTSYLGEERGDIYEGVDLTCDTVCQREQTIGRLLECLLRERIILVHSPPMTGKTTLSQLFEQKMLQSDETGGCVFRISLLWVDNMEPGSPWTFAEGFKKYLGITWGEFINQCNVNTFLIIDEVQKIYQPENEDEPRHGGKVFWSAFKHIIQTSRLHIVAFASYGHYGAYTTCGKHAVMDISQQNHLNKNSKWRFEDVRFTEEEFSDYFKRFCEKNLKILKKEDISLLFNYLSVITAYHPGLVAFTMNQIRERFFHTNELLSFAKVFSFLKSRNFYSYLTNIRANSRMDDLSDEEKRIADTVLFKKGGLKLQTEAIPHNSQIIKTNVLVDTGSISGLLTLNFPAPLLQVTYLQDRFGSVTRSRSPPNTFKDFIISVFAKMNSKVLQKSFGVGTDCYLLERVWQIEFYRASMQVLPSNIYVSVDVGAVFESEGYLYFYVNDQHNWAIELLQDGDKLQEHQQRFQKDGRHASIFEYAKEWVIINIRNSKKGPPEQKGKDVIYVLCAENFESVQLIYPDGTKDHVQLLGEEENLLGYNISEFLDDFT